MAPWWEGGGYLSAAKLREGVPKNPSNDIKYISYISSLKMKLNSPCLGPTKSSYLYIFDIG